MSWIDKGNYWIFTGEQRTDEWKKIRKYRLTGSNVGKAVGHSTFGKSEETIANEIIEPSGFTNENMEYGTITEPEARKWYEEQMECKVDEIGFAVPKWNRRIGGSPDGTVGEDGIIEIKCPKKMYAPLKKDKRWYTKNGIPGHIWVSHYDQMQFNMKVLERKWCDYIVYCPIEESVFVQRFNMDHRYWNKILEPKINIFVDKWLSGFEPVQPC